MVIATLGMALIIDSTELVVFGPFLKELPSARVRDGHGGGLRRQHEDIVIFCARS